MDLRHLRTFVAVADQGSVTKAALRLRTAQPALSRQINDLQQELGIKLFDHVGRRLVLTGEGEQLLEHCRNVLGQIGSLNERAELLRRGDSGVLRVAASPERIASLFSTFMRRYAERWPDVQVKFIEATGVDQLTLLERGEIHIRIGLIAAIQTDSHPFGSYPLPPVEFLASCEPSLQLGQEGTIEIGRLAPYPLLLQDSSFVMRKTFDAACRLGGLKPNILLESRSAHTLLELAEAGYGVAISSSVGRLDRYTLRTVRITHQRRRFASRRQFTGTGGARFRATRRASANCLPSTCTRSSGVLSGPGIRLAPQ